MNFTFTSAQLLGSSSESLWGQTFHRDNLFVTIEVFVEAASAPKAGQAILNSLIDSFATSQPQNLEAFREAIRSGLNDHTNIAVSAVVAWIYGDILYTRVINQGQFALSRGGRVEVILAGDGLVSGRIVSEDTLFFLSEHLVAKTSFSALRSVAHLTPEQIAETLAPALHSEDTPGAAGIIARVANPTEREPDAAPSVTTILSSKGRQFGQRLVEFITLVFSPLRSRSKRWSRRQWLTVIIFITLVIVFASNVFRGYLSRREERLTRESSELISSLRLRLEEGRSLIDVNSKRARTVLTEALSQAREGETKLKEREEKKQLSLLTMELEQVLLEATKIYKLSEVPIFYDLTLIKDNAKGNALTLYRSILAVLDTSQGAVYLLTTDTKRGEIIAGGERLTTPQHIAMHGDTVYVLTQNGIVAINIRSKEPKIVVPRDDSWGEIATIEAYAGNLYLLDAGKNSLWKYQALEEGFSKIITYVPDDQSHSFGSQSSLAIDGAVWAITRGKIVKFVQGRPEGSFSLSGLDTPLSTDTSIYTDETLNELYILDRGNKRIVVFDKNGVYQSQYVWENLANVASFVVAKDLQKIILVSANTIYAIDLRG